MLLEVPCRVITVAIIKFRDQTETTDFVLAELIVIEHRSTDSNCYLLNINDLWMEPSFPHSCIFFLLFLAHSCYLAIKFL